ncbi:thioredoxin domain-containing protein [Streptomyces sp. NPDC051776]|uniref:DsbA family protein n=1 Tax=Streptomyces sp. NPDC051776 TaxID=3155414 RepID=UPI0034380152
MAPAAPSRRRTSRRSIVIGACVALAALLLGALSQFATGGSGTSGSGSPGPEASDATGGSPAGGEPGSAAPARRQAGDAMAQGRRDAPVVLVEYADFACSFCGKFARDTEPGLVRKYVDSGVLRIEWRNLPIFGEDSERAARAAWAAGRQHRFWQFHRAAYADEDSKAKGFGQERLDALAREAGVPDLKRFRRDAGSDAARASVRRDQEEGYGLGATSTPSFLVNGRPIAGAQPGEVFNQAIDAATKAARKQPGGKGAAK